MKSHKLSRFYVDEDGNLQKRYYPLEKTWTRLSHVFPRLPFEHALMMLGLARGFLYLNYLMSAATIVMLIIFSFFKSVVILDLAEVEFLSKLPRFTGFYLVFGVIFGIIINFILSLYIKVMKHRNPVIPKQS